jgi:O-Antigen ligase
VRRVTAFLFLATLACVSFEKIQWQLAGTIGLAGILGTLFVVSFVIERLGQPPRGFPKTVAIVLLFGLAFLVVYLAGFYNLETEQAAAQFAKGLARFAITFAFAAAGIAYLARKPLRFYWLAVGVLCAGIAFNALYGIVQLAYAQAGGNLDQAVLGPLLGQARPINFYGAVEGADVYRPNALTNDPNHLGIVLLLPILILTPIYLRLERGHRFRLLLGILLPFLVLVELATLSRSGLLGLGVGTLILLIPYRRRFVSAAVLVPLGCLALILAWIVSRRLDFFETVARSRLDTQTGSTATHFDVYGLIGPALHGHWLFGLGLNTFSVYYEAVTGLTNWGPHSFYAALVIETGIVGTALFALFLFWVFRRLRAGHRLGRALAAMRDPLAARVRPLAWGLTAAIAGVMAANAFYLTMQQSYFYALTMLAVAMPVVFGRRLAR